MRSILEAFKTGQWSGRRCFVVGGGPSLKGFDLKHLNFELSIATNEMYRGWLPGIGMVQDERLFKGDGSIVGLKDRKDWYQGGFWPVYFKGHADAEEIEANDFIFRAHSCHTQTDPFGWGASLEGGLTYGGCVGLAALSLADALRASPVYLLGYDCGFGPKREVNCHSHYPSHWAQPEKSQQDIFDRWVKEFARHAPSVRGKVIVVGPSALECFKKISYSELMEELLK